MILHALQGKELPIYGDGMNVRDWLYVDDHCRGIDMVIGKGKPGECYNIGGNNEWHNIDIVKLVCSLVDEAFASNDELKKRFPECPPAYGKKTEILIRFVKDRPGHDRRYAIDASKAAAELGYSPAETFDSGIRKTLDWYLHNEQWWRGVMDGSYREWMKEQYEGR
jgi:dTDP-glucose 4,6-dehydratase